MRTGFIRYRAAIANPLALAVFLFSAHLAAAQGFGRGLPNPLPAPPKPARVVLPPVPPGYLDGFPRYTITDLGVLPGMIAVHATSISDSGYITGWAETLGEKHAILWKDGKLRDLGVIKGHNSLGFGVNSAGDVVGVSDAPTFDGPDVISSRPFLYHAGQMTNINGLVQPDLGSWKPAGINDNGQICGQMSSTQAGEFPCIWQNGRLIGLGNLGEARTTTAAINARGWVTGSSNLYPQGTPNAGISHAFIWQFGRMADLGTLGGKQSEGRSINRDGEIAGWSFVDMQSMPPISHAFFFRKGLMTDLGTLPGGRGSSASSINDVGQIVGVSEIGGDLGLLQSFLWQKGRMVPLIYLVPDNAGWVLDNDHMVRTNFYGQVAINNLGQIVGSGTHDGKQRAFLLTPITATPSATAAPSRAANSNP